MIKFQVVVYKVLPCDSFVHVPCSYMIKVLQDGHYCGHIGGSYSSKSYAMRKARVYANEHAVRFSRYRFKDYSIEVVYQEQV